MGMFDFFLSQADKMSIPKKEVCLDTPQLSIDPNFKPAPKITASTGGQLPTTVVLEKLRWEPSPNYRERKGRPIGIVLHHTGSNSFEGNISWMKNPEAKAAAQFCISRKGEIACLVNTKFAAFQAGISEWVFHGKKYEDLNHWTIGIEICNQGWLSKHSDGKYYIEDGRNSKEYKPLGEIKQGSITFPDGRTLSGWYDEYPEAQIESVVQLCRAIINKYPEITAEDIVTHYQIAPQRKQDPAGLNIRNITDRIFG